MTKTEIRAILFLHGVKQGNRFVLYSDSAVEATIEDLYKGFQKALGKEEKRKRTQYADPKAVNSPNPAVNAKLSELIDFKRNVLRKPMAQTSLEAMLKKWRDKGFTPSEVIDAMDDAINNQYQGVFPRKSFRKENPTEITPKEIDYSEGLPTKKKN